MQTPLIQELSSSITAHAGPIVWNLAGAVALWILGGFLITIIRGMVRRAMERNHVDATLIVYGDSSVSVLLRILLIVAILGAVGVSTFTFAGILTAAALAIGTAWSGLLTNFAAGVFLVLLRPFKVGEMITAAGVTGNVREIGLFTTTLDTADNVHVMVGNNKIFSDSILNYSRNPWRRVDLRAQIAHGVNPADAIARLKSRVAALPGVIADPQPSVEILEFNLAGTVIAVRPFCNNSRYWDVYFATNSAIQEVCSAAGYPVPEERRAIRQLSSA